MSSGVNISSGTILLTGATGFIGRHCVRALINFGVRPRILARDPEKSRRIFGADVDIFPGDLTDAASLAAACRGVRMVFNLAGSYSFGPAHRREMWRVNVDGTEQLLKACWEARVERVVHCSSAGILQAKGRLITADDLPERPPVWCHYKQSKWRGEKLALEWNQRGLPVIIASPSAPVGPEDERPTPTGRMFYDLLRGKFPACTRTGLNIIAVQDLAAGLLAVERHGQPGRRYILGGENLWLHDLMALAAEVGHCPAPRWTVPGPVIALCGMAGEAWGFVTGARNSRICWETAFFARQRQFFDVEPSFVALNWRPQITTRVAVADAVKWFADSLAKPVEVSSPACLKPSP